MEPHYLLLRKEPGKHLLLRGLRADLEAIAARAKLIPRIRAVVLCDSLPLQGPHEWRPASALLPTLEVAEAEGET